MTLLNADKASIKAAFTEIFGTESVGDLGGNLINQIGATSKAQIACVVYPNTQSELIAAIALAHKNQWQILTSNLNWGGLVRFDRLGIVINTSRLNRLIDHAVGDLTVTCEAGIKFRDLQNILAKSGQFLAIDPAYPETITLGEIVSTANTGSLRQRYGGVRDMLLGISFVRADGKLVKAGGRVVKNVAGYDLMKLMTGSYESLGVVAQVTFRLYPLPQCDRTIIITAIKTEIKTEIKPVQAQSIDIARAKILISNLTPLAMDILSTAILSKLEISSDLALIMRFGGLTQGVEAQIRRLSVIVQELGLEVKAIEDNTWEKIQCLIWEDSSIILPVICPVICKVGTLSDLVVKNMIQISTDIKDTLGQIHVGSGLGILRYEGSDYPEILLQILKARNLLESTGGFLTVLAAPPKLKDEIDVWGYSGNARQTMIALKHKFDPHNLLNPCGYIG